MSFLRRAPFIRKRTSGGGSFIATVGQTSVTGGGKSPTTWTYWGWNTFTSTTIPVGLFPGSSFGSTNISPIKYGGDQVLGVVSRDDGGTGTNAMLYYIYFNSTYTGPTPTGLTIGGTAVSVSSITSSISGTGLIVTITPTASITTLFGTTIGANKTVLIT